MNKQQTAIVIIALLVALVGAAFFFSKEKDSDLDEEKNDNVVIENNVGFNISSEEVMNKIRNKEDFILLDVRPEEEYWESHIVGATFFPLQVLSERSLASFDLGYKNAEIVIYADGTGQSLEAYNLMSSWGYSNLKDLTKGLPDFIETASTSKSDFVTYPVK